MSEAPDSPDVPGTGGAVPPRRGGGPRRDRWWAEPEPEPTPDEIADTESPDFEASPGGNLPVPIAHDEHRDIATKRGWSYVNLDDEHVFIAADVVRLMQPKDARRFEAIPVKLSDGELTIAVADPDDFVKHGGIRPLFPDMTVRFAYSNPKAIRKRIDTTYSALAESDAMLKKRASERDRNQRVDEGGDLGRVASGDDSANVALLGLLLEQALHEGASDVHIEPKEERFNVRIRVDGKLRVVNSYPILRLEGLVNLIKVRSEMRTDKSLTPDSGVLQFTPPAGGRPVDIRVETTPTAWGQGVVMRLQSEIWRELSTLGFSPGNEKRFRDAIEQPYGVILLTGPTGSGKALRLDTPIPTPTGWTTMGALEVGSQVLGRDGRPCRVTGLSPIDTSPELYRVTFSDGQHILADRDHQWLVSTTAERHIPRDARRQAAIERYEEAHRVAERLDWLASHWRGSSLLTVDEAHLVIKGKMYADFFPSALSIYNALRATDCPRQDGERPVTARAHAVSTTHTVTAYDSRAVLTAIADSRSAHAAHARALLEGATYAPTAGCVEIGSWFGVGNWLAAETVKRLGLVGTTVTQIAPKRVAASTRRVAVVEYPADIAFKSLALRLRQRFSQRPVGDTTLSRLTTGEMLASGGVGGARNDLAVPVTRPLDLPAADLPIDPYLFGYWLGDGHTDAGRITVGAEDHEESAARLAAIRPITSTTWKDSTAILTFGRVGGADECLSGHDEDEWVRHVSPTTGRVQTYCRLCRHPEVRDLPRQHWSLHSWLRHLGVLGDKHIPDLYMFASAAQRLAVLQGLMDTDGSIDPSTGSCELGLSNKTLVADALRLIRSLGIKASVTWDARGGYRRASGEHVEKVRHRVHFTTSTPVFRLTRKARHIKPAEDIRDTSKWLYVQSIEPVEKDDPAYGPVRCISVDSEDHAYLCGDGFVVTSNSTTNYSALREKISPEVKIITLENPIEFKVPEGISQMEMKADQGMTFAGGLRSILRQDPDIILVGEIRDPETAETAVDAAMTGHLVFSTLHTNDAAGVIPRLTRMGIEPFLLSNSLLCAVGQRLVRRLCIECKVERRYTEEELLSLGFDPVGAPEVFYEPNPSPCPVCAEGNGYKGRVPIHEVLTVDADLADAIAEGAPQSQIVRLAVKAGMTLMRQDGFEKAKQGMTSVSEINATTRREIV